MSRPLLLSLLAVCFAFSLLSPTPLPGVLDEIGLAHADDDDNDEDRPIRRPPPRVRAVAKPPSRSKPPTQPTRPKPPPKPQPKPAPVVQQPSLKAASYEPRQVLAMDASPAQLNQAKQLGFTIESTVSLPALGLQLTRLRPPAKLSPPQALQTLQREIPGGKFVLNHIYRANTDPCQDGRCYGSVLIGWQSSEQCGAGIKLGMVDTAANTAHPALQGRKLVTRTFAEDQRASAALHGTAIAALLVGAPSSEFAGLLPAAELYAADAFMGADPAKTHTNVLLLTQSFNWLLEQQVTVINASLSGPDNGLLQEVVKRLHQQQRLIVAAAGNNGPNAPPVFPAAYPEAVAVTAVDSLLRPYRRANRGDYLTLAAPGVRIWTPGVKGGEYRDGTSFAAPYVTAVIAQLRHRQPETGPTELMAQLQSKVRDLGTVGKDAVFGWGLVQNPIRCDKSGPSRPPAPRLPE